MDRSPVSHVSGFHGDGPPAGPLGTRSALFVDRDGVLIEDRVSFARTWEDVVILDNAVEALGLAARHDIPVFVVSNQSIVGRGEMSLDEIDRLFRRIVEEIRQRGGRIDGYIFCPDAPGQPSEYRKPAPGMVRHLLQTYELDPGQCFMVGDALRDLQAAEGASVPAVLVRTGQGPEHEARMTDEDRARWPVTDDLLSALQSWLATRIG